MTESSGETGSPAMTRGMKITIAVVTTLIAAALIAITLAWSPWASDGSASGRPAPPGATPSPGATASTGPDAGESDASGGSATGPGPSPGATPQKGSEVLPPATAPGSGVPPLKKADPLMKAPLPASATSDAGLVTGFPRQILGPIKGSTVMSSSIATEGTHTQITLIAVTTKAQDDIAAHFSALWAELGLKPSATSNGTVQYTGAHESTTLAVEPSGTGNRYTLYGSFRTE